MTCDRLARDVDLDPQGELAEHVAGCADCTAALADHRRIATALGTLGAQHARRSDHVDRVFAAQRRRRVLLASGGAAVAAVVIAAAAVLWLRPRPPVFAVDVLDGGGAPHRGDGHLGDRLRVRADDAAALWVYRDEHELVLVCPPGCRRDGDALAGEVVLGAPGRYQVVWLSAPVVVPVGELERDVAAAARAGAEHELREVLVR